MSNNRIVDVVALSAAFGLSVFSGFNLGTYKTTKDFERDFLSANLKDAAKNARILTPEQYAQIRAGLRDQGSKFVCRILSEQFTGIKHSSPNAAVNEYMDKCVPLVREADLSLLQEPEAAK
ncbi:MAG: hypothetical protein H6860_04775 [Rhodospirillales bacterium]|nr:hypothetical protein [Alphaproteobacteria bacterium]MCB9981695.1 hypothetical protein [Rhodospirillales bacterium]